MCPNPCVLRSSIARAVKYCVSPAYTLYVVIKDVCFTKQFYIKPKRVQTCVLTYLQQLVVFVYKCMSSGSCLRKLVNFFLLIGKSIGKTVKLVLFHIKIRNKIGKLNEYILLV